MSTFVARPVLLLPLFVIAGAAASCATPSPLVRLYPNADGVVWVAGRASVMREQGGVEVAVAFDHQDGGNLGLRVEVENRTENQLDVDPSTFTFTDCRSMAVGSCGLTHPVINPERVLNALDERQSREQASAANSQAFLGTMVILSAVGDVASVASGHANRDTGSNTANAAAVMESDAAVHNSELASVAVQQQIWSNEALRRNTLFPGRGTSGRVYLPIDLDAQIVWLHVRTGGQIFSFPFRQTVTGIHAGSSSSWQGDRAVQWRPGRRVHDIRVAIRYRRLLPELSLRQPGRPVRSAVAVGRRHRRRRVKVTQPSGRRSDTAGDGAILCR